MQRSKTLRWKYIKKPEGTFNIIIKYNGKDRYFVFDHTKKVELLDKDRIAKK